VETDLKKVYDRRDGDYAECHCPACKAPITFAKELIPVDAWERLSEARI